MNLVYINGNFVKKEETSVSLFDRGFLYGDGIFEGIRIYNGNIFKCKEHTDRLFKSAKALNINIDFTRQEMMSILVECVQKNQMKDGYIRLVVSRGNGDLSLDPRNVHTKPNIFIVVQELDMFSEERYESGIHAVTVPTKRNIPDALNPKVKSLNYLNNILAKMDSNLAGADDAIMVNAEGYVTEGSVNNIFIVRDKTLITPPAYIGALEGITRQTIIDIAKKTGYNVKEEVFTRYDVQVADEVFLTGTAVEMITVTRVDGRQIGNGVPGPVFKHLASEFKKVVELDGIKVFNDSTLSN